MRLLALDVEHGHLELHEVKAGRLDENVHVLRVAEPLAGKFASEISRRGALHKQRTARINLIVVAYGLLVGLSSAVGQRERKTRTVKGHEPL